MIKRFLSLGIVVTLICCLCGTSVFAQANSDANQSQAKAAATEKDVARANDKLRADVLKLVADTKAAKNTTPPAPNPFQQTKRNNLSTAAKIGIVAAIGGAIFAIVLYRALHDDDN